MESGRILPAYTYDDYCLWEGRWELIDGIPYAMVPAPSPKHQWLAVNVAPELRQALKRKRCESCGVYDFLDVKIGVHTVVQPDVLILCSPVKERFVDFPPYLVVEILSNATEMKDRLTKFTLYETFAITYYAIVDHENEILEIYRLTNEKYVLQFTGHEGVLPLSFGESCSIPLDLEKIWS